MSQADNFFGDKPESNDKPVGQPHSPTGHVPGADDFPLVALCREASPGDWHMPVAMARTALRSRNLEEALALYQLALSNAGEPAPVDLLGNMCTGLANAAHIPELLRLTAPRFVAGIHGLAVGSHLVHAYLTLGQFSSAREILDQLYALKQSDWRKQLDLLDQTIAKEHLDIELLARDKNLTLDLIAFSSPVWLHSRSIASELFPINSDGEPKITFLGGTTDIPDTVKRPLSGPHALAMRMSRSLLAYMAEQALFHTDARVQFIIPWTFNPPQRFFRRAAPWPDNDAASYARQAFVCNDYIVTSHIKALSGPWTVELRLVRTIDAKCVGTVTMSWQVGGHDVGIPELVRRMLSLLADHADVTLCQAPPNYQIPANLPAGRYLEQLHHLLVFSCACVRRVNDIYLIGERFELESSLQLCNEQPQNVTLRIILAQKFADIKKLHPNILAEYRNEIMLLQKERPLPEPAHGVVQRIINAALAA